ncbi:ROK family protein [Ectobacillus panaciterrae]|uniref:ROK family protein n=1 Tax=Ectobacillus panaciterrae TaxID=363872 RepID=UPI000405CCDB|nr:ROK family protein [Ectobacillus panaciterrae]
MIFGAIEAGGTKFVCGIGSEHGEIFKKVTIPTTTPDETMGKVINYFKGKHIDAMGIGSFGPIDLHKNSSTYGYITSTPKPHWGHFNLVGEIQKEFPVPIGFDTDVNAAALGEIEWGAAKSVDSCMYMTVGTGIGVGAVVNGELLHGLTHPEMGHIFIRRHEGDLFEGNCPYHKDCLEGMAAGPAIEKRWGKKGIELAEEAKVWELEAYYLAQAIANYILILSPKKVILGGGVMKQQHLIPMIRDRVIELLNGYLHHESITSDQIEGYIVSPGLGENAGLCGALALAKKEYLGK